LRPAKFEGKSLDLVEVARIPVLCLHQLCYGLIQLYDTMAEALGLRSQPVRRVLRGAICNGCIPLLADFGGYGLGCRSERVHTAMNFEFGFEADVAENAGEAVDAGEHGHALASQ
jgi:hypothetical protein